MRDAILLFVRVMTALLVFTAHTAALRGDLAHHYSRHLASEPPGTALPRFAFFPGQHVRLASADVGNSQPYRTNARRSDQELPSAHLVWGILGLLAVGCAWLAQVGTEMPGQSQSASAMVAVLYGICGALTLDEFALWSRLQDVYWLPPGRESIEAAMVFGALLAIGAFGGNFFHGLTRSFFHRKAASK